ncbi:uncharacterized protein RB166_004490 [Leptodactylus fuscus]
MGSGSSKSKRRVISFCGQQPLHPTEIPKKESAPPGKPDCEQEESNEKRAAKATQPVLETKNNRPPPIDPDLQLLDDILTESEDCLSWQEPTCIGQKMTNWPHANCNPGSLSQGQENQRRDKDVLRMLGITPEVQTASSESEETQDRQQDIEDDCSKTASGIRRVFENNNLPMQSHSCPVHMEEQSPMAYDDTEEALMDSIEQEYSELHPLPPMCCGKM